jgi:oligosaccharyl transferase (archaeosortase A-associated)
LGFSQFTKEQWKLWAKPLIYSCLGGLFLVMYLASWQGAMLFTLIISIYFVVQFILDFFQHQSSAYLGITGFVYFLITAIVFYPTALTYSARLVLVTAAILPLFFIGLSALFTRTKLNRGFYPLLLVIGVSAYLGAIYMTHSSSIQYLADQSALVFFPQGFGASTTSEMQPFLSVLGSFSTQVAWENFTTSFFLVRPWPIPGLGIISFIVLIWLFIKNRGRQKLHLFLIIWTLVMAAATLVQRRFAYYLSINIALLSGYLAWQFIWLGGMRNLVSGINNKVEKLRDKTAREKRKKRRESQSIAVHYLRVAVVSVVVFVLFFLFNILTVKQEASVTPLAPSDAWEEALTWMKENTPEPLGASTEYFKYQSYDYVYPPSIYSVTSWWDYGYWITRIGHRIPIVNPSQNAYLVSKVANAFVSRSELEADTITESLRSRYLICDTAMVTSKFWGIVTWTGREKEEFYEDYYVNQNGKLVAATVFYPEYFESVLVRLYNFDGKAVTTIEPTVITFIEKIGQDGKPFKQITGAQKFNTYKEAMAFIAEAGPANHRLVSMSPFTSPVALSRILNYRLVFSSKETNNTVVPGMAIPQVKIYQYLGN